MAIRIPNDYRTATVTGPDGGPIELFVDSMATIGLTGGAVHYVEWYAEDHEGRPYTSYWFGSRADCIIRAKGAPGPFKLMWDGHAHGPPYSDTIRD